MLLIQKARTRSYPSSSLLLTDRGSPSSALQPSRASRAKARCQQRWAERTDAQGDLPCEMTFSLDAVASTSTLVSTATLRPGVESFMVETRGSVADSFDRLASLQGWVVMNTPVPVAGLHGVHELAFGWNGYDLQYFSAESTLQPLPAKLVSGSIQHDIEVVASWVVSSMRQIDHAKRRWVAIAQFTAMGANSVRGWHKDPHLRKNDVVATFTLGGSGVVKVGCPTDPSQQCVMEQRARSCYTMTRDGLHRDRHYVKAGDHGRFSLTLRFKAERYFRG